MIHCIYTHLNHFKTITELLASDRQCDSVESDKMTMMTYNLVSMPLFRSLGVKSMTELKNAAIATGCTVLVDHDFYYSELYDEGKLCELKSIFDADKLLVYAFSKKVDSVAEAIDRYQRRFIADEYIDEYFKFMIDYDYVNDKQLSYEESKNEAIDLAVRRNKPKGAGSYLIIETNADGLHFVAIDNNKKIIDQDSFILSDMPEFEKEYENIEF